MRPSASPSLAQGPLRSLLRALPQHKGRFCIMPQGPRASVGEGAMGQASGSGSIRAAFFVVYVGLTKSRSFFLAFLLPHTGVSVSHHSLTHSLPTGSPQVLKRYKRSVPKGMCRK